MDGKKPANPFGHRCGGRGCRNRPRHFKRRFKTATGESPLSYLQRLRVEAAKRYLEKTRDSLSEITAKVGYEDLNSFRRLFIKHTGLSPRHYRDKFAGQGMAE